MWYLLIAIISIIVISNYLESDSIIKKVRKNIKPTSKVVVSFSTIPERVQYLNLVVKRLLSQSLKPDMIYVCIPYYSHRSKKMYPEFTLHNFPNVTLVRCNDFGPATKLLGCIPFESSPETMIITIDDDRIYKPDMIQKLVNNAETYKNCAVGYNALDKNLISTVCHPTKNLKDPYIHYLEGFGGVLYRRKFITDEMIEFYNNLSPECFLSDDLTISGWLDKNNICRIRICEKSQIQDDDIDDKKPLHKQARKHVYDICHQEMKNI